MNPSTPTPTDALDLPRDRWGRRLAAMAHGVSAAPGRGRVLRLKLGYNPNSSSVGSVVTTLLWSATAGSVMLNIAAALLRERASGDAGDVATDAGQDRGETP